MGSFNMTCFASQRTIAPGNQSFIIPIVQQATYSPVQLSLGDLKLSQFGIAHSTCYPTAFWDYAGPMIEGTYYDYGCFHLTDNPSNYSNIVSFFNILHKTLFKVEQGENSSHDLPIDFQSMYEPNTQYSFEELTSIWDEMWNVGQENRLFLNINNHPRQLQFSLLHKKTFQFFHQYFTSSTFNGKTFDTFVDDSINIGNDLLFKYIAKAEEFSQAPDMFNATIDSAISRITNFENLRFGQSLEYSNFYNNNTVVKEYILAFVKKNPEAKKFNQPTINKIKKVCLSALKHRMIHVGLDTFNIKLAPPTYGYQDYSNNVCKSFLAFIEAINGSVKKVKKE